MCYLLSFHFEYLKIIHFIKSISGNTKTMHNLQFSCKWYILCSQHSTCAILISSNEKMPDHFCNKALRYVHFFQPQKSFPFFYSTIRKIAIPSTHLTTTRVSETTIFNHTLLVLERLTLLTPARIDIQALKIKKKVKNQDFDSFFCIIGHIFHNYAIQRGNWWLSSG